MFDAILTTPQKGCNYWPGADKTVRNAISVKSAFPGNEDPLAIKFRHLQQGLQAMLNRETYLPVCPGCNLCISTRLSFEKFSMSASQRKKHRQFGQTIEKLPAAAALEDPQIPDLYSRYMNSRHADGNSVILTRDEFIESHRSFTWAMVARDKNGTVTATMFADQMNDSFSGDRLIYDPEKMALSPGISMMLSCIEIMRRDAPKGHLYMGVWAENSPKLDYKKQFSGMECHARGKWVPLEDIRQIVPARPSPTP